ncbi:MAG: aminotransferase class I/II-fold pyridoxal phosphate-dependent enzyme [Xylanivirga thermophila]|jgi:aminotransferase|uniref:aminotransferase class I/II-fold pyridoxal phosphate-dependent enzyme n=1 Tax=Xylanivirga thermophila TaxID=2496273 RepID=UPI0039F5ED66
MNWDDKISSRVRTVPPSGIRKFFDIVNQMEDAISLGVGEPDFVTPWNIREASIYSIEKGMTYYTSNWGLLELREAISRYLSGRFQIEYNPKDEIFVTVGASEGIDLALRTIIEPGDEVLIPDPSYVSYMPCVTFAGGKAVPIKCSAEHGFKLMPDKLKDSITHRTKALILPYPNNPTGGIMNREELEAIAQVLNGTDIIVISDEIYAELTYEGKHVSFASIPGMKERTIVINGFSKAFAMTGWRMGYVAGNKDVIKTMLKIHQYTMLCAPIMGQVAALEALRSGFEDDFATVRNMVDEYNHRRRIMLKGFRDMGLECFEPLGAFYVFPSIKETGMESEEFCERLLKEQKVAVVPGTAFGPSGEGFVRCSYAYSVENINVALDRIGDFVSKYI